MNETKLKERIANAYNAFFENSYQSDSNQIERIEPHETFVIKDESKLSKNLSNFFNILKGVLFFIPGALFLNTASFALTLVFLFGVPDKMPPIIDFNFFMRIGLIFGGGTLFTWFGLGDLRNLKHSLIPLSIASTGAILAFLFGLFTIPFPELRNYIFEISLPFYLLPIALIVPNLVKMWLDKPEENL